MNNNLFSGILALTFIAAVSNVSASNELVTNGGFEDSTNGWNFSGNVQVTSANVYAQYGWTDNGYVNGNVALFGSGDQAGGNVSQEINTISGNFYKLTFDYGAITGNGRPQNLIASINDGNTVLNSYQVTAYGTSQLAQLMTNNEIDFTALSSHTTLYFADANIADGNSIDGVLDNVSVNAISAIPEPETYAMLLSNPSIFVVKA